MLTWLLASVVCLAPQAPGAEADEADEADEAAYARAIGKRADDVLVELRLGDRAVADRVRRAIIDEYRGLRALHDARDEKVRQIQAESSIEEAARAGRIGDERASTEAATAALNGRFLAALAKDLAPAQVEAVKDKMTYHKLQVTYDGYLEMLPGLTAGQKEAVFAMLREARDKAVYAGSSEEKAAIFGRYKGRVNNYLSKEGYDLKQAAKEWAERRKAAR
jgi:hypothetical protein